MRFLFKSNILLFNFFRLFTVQNNLSFPEILQYSLEFSYMHKIFSKQVLSSPAQ